MSTMSIKVLIVDDDDVWREGLQQYLTYDAQIQVIGEASTKEAAISFVQQFIEIDVVLMDINLSGKLFDGIDTMLEMSAVSDCKFIMLTSFQHKEVIQEAFSSGAMNYITKQYIECIPQAIKDAHLNQASIHHSASAILRSEWIRLTKNISNREIELLQYMGKGYSLQQISEALHIEKQSVSNSIGRISRKLGYNRFNRSILERIRKWGWIQ